jgi:hypothetical protein
MVPRRVPAKSMEPLATFPLHCGLVFRSPNASRRRPFGECRDGAGTMVVSVKTVAILAAGIIAAGLPLLTGSSLAQTAEFSVSAARAEALRECNAVANKFAQYTWGNYQSDQLRACMAMHGQPE